jgi:hypothetical protein
MPEVGRKTSPIIIKGAAMIGIAKGLNAHRIVDQPIPVKPIGICMCFLVVVLGMVCGDLLLAQALDPIPAHIMSGLQAGVVTSIGNKSLFISGKEYTLDPEIEIRDQEDNVLQADVIKSGHEVKFHLKKGDGNKIDVLIVYMPQ